MRPPRRGSAVSTADHTTELTTEFKAAFKADSFDRRPAEPEGILEAEGPRTAEARHLSLIRGDGPGARQLCLPLEYEVAPGVPAIPPTPTHLHLVGSAESPVLTETAGDGAPPDGAPTLPPPGLWTMRLARAIAEVAHGERPAGQLSPHVARDQLMRLSRRGQAVVRHPAGRAQRGTTRLRTVRGVRVCPVAPGVVEASAVLVGGPRAQAIALRLEAVGSQWIATAVELV